MLPGGAKSSSPARRYNPRMNKVLPSAEHAAARFGEAAVAPGRLVEKSRATANQRQRRAADDN